MNELIEKINSLIPHGEHIDRMYRAYEGDLRVITKNASGYETRYTVRISGDEIEIRNF